MGSWLSANQEPVDMEGPAAQQVRKFIDSDEIVIFSKSYCPYCDKAKKVFESLNKRYVAIELNKRDDGNVMQDILQEMTGARTVPRVFIKGKFVGGCSDVEALHKSGGLEPLFA